MSRLRMGIVGAGMAGLYAAYRLREQGHDVMVFEKDSDVGGTWHVNDYPGLHVDVITRSYEFAEMRSSAWSRRYAPGVEVGAYLKSFTREKDLYPLIRLGTEVTGTTWRGDAWEVVTADGSAHVFDAVLVATGFLRVPKMPRFPGLDGFQGPAFHSSRWDHSVSLDGKRIGVIGTGSSGIQIVSELGKRGHDVVHFIRTPQWIQIKENPPISWLEKVLLCVPATAKYWDRRMQRLRVRTEGPETWRLEPGADRNAANQRFLDMLEREIPDPVLRKRLTPAEPLGCKRIPKSPDYYQVLQRPNVRPVFGPVGGVEPDGIVDADGTKHPVDVLVLATGFDTHAYMRPLRITGANGVTIDELWRDSVFSYRGVGLPQMPNLFLLNGPFAPINSLAIPLCLRDEVGYLLRLLDVIGREGKPMAPTRAATERFVQTIRDRLPNTTYSLCDNWYTDASGTQVIWPFTRAEHGRQYDELNLDDFETFGLPVKALR
ncbi:flavin-containing monooxygenase [Amycolatopsis alkalitolerans]|uniref:NAD(P)/FAD-dependent oxidoreductase n=1 Tax=Amycolatopsis alkalitolerans TaxID=2547244 RepID=A0A5C4M8A5_9PSEU|nr:NAD(P)/FAD-dependent oxidoreductase [Amycolatopsis alkalitolerans]TNC29225.1 NAD(P)/FAD-dependent oxidoreductase [Amycolatopsis alkalitolerans]